MELSRWVVFSAQNLTQKQRKLKGSHFCLLSSDSHMGIGRLIKVSTIGTHTDTAFLDVVGKKIEARING